MFGLNDLLIAIAYLCLACELVVALLKYPHLQQLDVQMKLLLVMLSLLILCCGVEYMIRFLGFQGTFLFTVVNTLSALVSLATSIYLLPMVPTLLDKLDKSINKEVELSRSQLFTFMSFLCHEVRNPLFIITSSTQVLMDSSKMGTDERNMVEAIQSSAELMLRLVSDVLDLQNIRTGKLRLERRDFDLQHLLGGLESTTRIQMNQRDQKKAEVDLIFKIDPEVPRCIHGDSIRKLQIFHNLLSNAVKYTENGYVELHASVYNTEKAIAQGVKINCISNPQAPTEETKPGQKTRGREMVVLKFVVTDTGVGIDSEKLETIFQAYSQAKLSDYRMNGGTGLGLAIIVNLIAAMGGKITVESTPGKGSTFQVLLPIQISKPSDIEQLKLLSINNDDSSSTDWSDSTSEDYGPIMQRPFSTSRPLDELVENSVDSPASISTAKSDIASSKILVVDDNGVNRKILFRMLSYLGIDCQLAVNGLDAVEKYQESRNMTGNPHDPFYGLIFMDLQMPVMDGYEAIAKIREMDPTVPIAALTANALAEERNRTLELGANEFMTKPLLRDDLKKACERLALKLSQDT